MAELRASIPVGGGRDETRSINILTASSDSGKAKNPLGYKKF
jgi:hypothetical protein